MNSCVSRCIKLALVHDMAECIVGDIAPSDNISKAEKHRREEASDFIIKEANNKLGCSRNFSLPFRKR